MLLFEFTAPPLRSAARTATLMALITSLLSLLACSSKTQEDGAAVSKPPTTKTVIVAFPVDMEGVNEVWDRIAVAPVLVEEKALAFAACGVRERDGDVDLAQPRERWELVAPTDLGARLRLTDGQQISVRLLPAGLHRPDAPHQR